MVVRLLLLLASFCKTGFWFIPFFAWLVGATDPGPFVLFHLAFAVAFTGQFALRASGSDDRHAPDRSFIPTR